MIPIRLPLAVLAAALVPLLGACRDEAVPETEPRQISPSPFEYPEALWDAGVEGRTVLRIRINEAGTVDSVEVEATSGHAAFDSAAVAGTDELRFEPARRGDEAVARWYRLPVDFNLPPDHTEPPPAEPATEDAS